MSQAAAQHYESTSNIMNQLTPLLRASAQHCGSTSNIMNQLRPLPQASAPHCESPSILQVICRLVNRTCRPLTHKATVELIGTVREFQHQSILVVLAAALRDRSPHFRSRGWYLQISHLVRMVV